MRNSPQKVGVSFLHDFPVSTLALLIDTLDTTSRSEIHRTLLRNEWQHGWQRWYDGLFDSYDTYFVSRPLSAGLIVLTSIRIY